jgi:plasmid replication initiation protein
MATLSRKTQTKTKPSNIVKIKNDLVEAFIKRNNLTALKLIFYIARDSDNIDTSDIMNITLNSREVCEYCRIDAKTLRKNLIAMQETSISWKTDDAEHFVSVLPKLSIGYNGTIKLTMFRDVLNMIKDVQNRYTLVNAEQLMLMTSKHSARMLLLLERLNGYSDNALPKATYELDELNMLFGTRYKRIKDFEREVIVIALSDLNNNSKLSFTYDLVYDKQDKHKPGRASAVGITIYPRSNAPHPTLF